MPLMSLATTSTIAILSSPIKDLYTLGKDKFGFALAKWSNSKNISALAKKIANFEKVKTIWQRDKEVKLSTFYYPSRVIFPTGITKKVTSLKDIQKAGGIVIEGTVGQGKSIFLRYLCVQEIQHHSSGRIPVFVELRKLDSVTTLRLAVHTALLNLGFEVNDDLFDYYADSGKIVLMLDGFDELTESLTLTVVTQLENWAERYQNLQIIVSSRPGGKYRNQATLLFCI